MCVCYFSSSCVQHMSLGISTSASLPHSPTACCSHEQSLMSPIDLWNTLGAEVTLLVQRPRSRQSKPEEDGYNEEKPDPHPEEEGEAAGQPSSSGKTEPGDFTSLDSQRTRSWPCIVEWGRSQKTKTRTIVVHFVERCHPRQTRRNVERNRHKTWPWLKLHMPSANTNHCHGDEDDGRPYSTPPMTSPTAKHLN